MENPIKMDDLGGKTHYFRKHPDIPPQLDAWNINQFKINLKRTGTLCTFDVPRCPSSTLMTWKIPKQAQVNQAATCSPKKVTALTKTQMGVSLNGGTPKTPQNDHF